MVFKSGRGGRYTVNHNNDFTAFRVRDGEILTHTGSRPEAYIVSNSCPSTRTTDTKFGSLAYLFQPEISDPSLHGDGVLYCVVDDPKDG
eukprot:5079305-Lingulodinium_polyedra.AAC.1